MSQEDRDHYIICSRLLNSESPKDIAKDFDTVSYPTILRYKRELEEARLNNSLADYMKVSEEVLLAVSEKLVEDAPSELKGEIRNIASELKGTQGSLQVLSTKLLHTATAINDRILARVHAVENVSEIESLTDSLCKLQNAFFNRPVTQVNVQNNYDQTGNHRYSNWLGDKPKTPE